MYHSDVALAQIVAMENADIVGRHCLCNEAMHLSTVLQIIHEAFHDMDLPTRKVGVDIKCVVLFSVYIVYT